MKRVDRNSGEVITGKFPFVTKYEVILEGTDIDDLYTAAIDKIIKSIEIFKQGSGWEVKSVVKLE
jgi:hypothetical protein